MHYEYRITSDTERFGDVRMGRPDGQVHLAFMARVAARRLSAGASWAEVQFVQVDDDGTFEVLRRLRLD